MNEQAKNLIIVICGYLFLGIIIAILTGAIIYNDQQSDIERRRLLDGNRQLNTELGKANTELNERNRELEEIESEFSQYRIEAERENNLLRENLEGYEKHFERIENIKNSVRNTTGEVRTATEGLRKIFEAVKTQKMD